MIDRIRESLDELSAYSEMPRESYVELEKFAPNVKIVDDSKGSIHRLLYNVLGLSIGSYTTKDLNNIIDEYNKNASAESRDAIKKLIRIYSSDDDKIKNISGEQKLSIIQIDTIRVTPAGQDVTAVATFLSALPTIELSRCVPYLTIDVQTPVKPISIGGQLNGLSLLKFINGASKPSKTESQFSLALGNDETGVELTPNATVSGMELFTSPQTFVNPDEQADLLRAGRVIDKFRPFMSIERFSVELTSQVGFFAYKSADLELTLHDRSRLSEIASFVKPDLYGTTNLLIEYGWSHPDSANTIGKFINAMRVREVYGIVNASFTMAKSGEVKIKLKLFTRGMSDMHVVKIGDAINIDDASSAVRDLQKTIVAIKERLSLNNATANKEIRGQQYLFAGSDDIGASLILSDDSKSAVRKFLSTQTTNPSLSSLKQSLKLLYGTDGTGGLAHNLSQNIATAITTKIDKFRSANIDSDPFLFTIDDKLQNNKTSVDAKKGYVSLAKLFATFVGAPLAAQGNEKYEEVQMIFYPFNASAGKCSNHNISEFTININELKSGLIGLARTKGISLTIGEFIEYITNNFIDDISNQAYGLSSFYRTTIDTKSGSRTQPEARKGFEDKNKLFDAVQAKLLANGSADGTFKPPQIDIIVETVPVIPKAQGESLNSQKSKTILKLHFFDKCATAYDSLSALILANRDEYIKSIGDMSNNTSNEYASVMAQGLKKAKDFAAKSDINGRKSSVNDKIRKIGGNVDFSAPDDVYNVTFNSEDLRTFLRQNMPTITYGTSATGIKDANFATQQVPLLSTINMLKSGTGDATTPSGLTKALLPLRTLPARVSMTTIGCPLFRFMQQFFIDFGTNTTIDNIYGVNKLTHEISAGKFESKVDLVPLDAYGQYESLANQVGIMLKQLDEIEKS